MGEVALTFADYVREERERAKARAKRKRRPILLRGREERAVSPDEVIAEIVRLGGPEIKRRTLRLWEQRELIPHAVRRRLGRSKGSAADYPPETPAEGLAAARLLREGIPADPLSKADKMVKLTFEEVRAARHIGTAAIQGPIPVQGFAPYRLATLRRKGLGELAEWRRKWRQAEAVHPSGFEPGKIGYLSVLARIWKVLTLYHGFKWAATVLAAQEQRYREGSPCIAIFSIPPGRTYAAVAFYFRARKKTLVVGAQKLGVDAAKLKGRTGFVEIW